MTPVVSNDVVRFEECQPAWRNPVAWAGVAPVILVTLGLFVAQVGLGIRLGSSPPSDGLMLLIAGLGCVLVPALLMMLRLTTRVDSRSVRVRLWPLPGREIPLVNIELAEAIAYRPVRDAGGWGLRYSSRYGSVMNMYGHHGVAIRLRGDDRWLIGSQRAEELAGVLRAGGPPEADAGS